MEKYDLDYHLFRHRFVWGLGIAVLAVTGVAALFATAASERYYRFDSILLAAPACWTAAVLVFAFGARKLTRLRTWTRVTMTTVMATVVGFTAPVIASAHALDRSEEVDTVERSDGRYTLVAESFVNVIDPSCRVWLRENAGPMSRQALAWERLENPCPESMEFLDGDQIRISVPDASEALTRSYDPDTVRVHTTG